MLTQAKEVVDAWRASQRTLDIKVLVNGTTYTARDINSLKYDSGAYTGETFAIGSTYSNSVQIEFSHLVEGLKLGMKVLPSIGIKTASGYVYEPLGVFVISNEIKMDRNNNLTTISASDQFCGLEGIYESSLSYPAKVLDVIAEVCAKAGVKVNTGDLARLPKQSDLPTPITGQSYRKALGWIAQLYVGYALFDRQGLFTIRTIAEPNYSLDPSQYEQAGLVKNEATYKIGGIQCQTTITTETRDGEKTETTQTYQAGSSSGAQIKLENNIMTVERLNDIWERLKDLNFYPFSLNWFGNPAIEAGDWLRLKDKQGNSFVVPNNSYTLDFNGGLSAVSKADQMSSSAQAISWSGSVMQAIKDLQVRNAPDGTVIYPTTVTSPPENAKVNDIWFKKNGNDTELWVYEKQDDGSGVWKRNDLANDEIKKQIEEQQTALEEARSKADQAYHSAENAHLTADTIYKDFMSVQTDMSAQITDASQKAQETADNYTKMKHQVDSDLNALTKVTDNLTSNVGKLTTDVNGVKGQYATLDGRISEFSAGLEGVNAQLKDAKGQLATVKLTADSAAANFSSTKGDIASLKTKANEIEQQMLSKVGNDVFESFRASTAQELRSKLTATDLNGYVRASEFTHTADSLKANITTIGDQINNLDIGGRNLLKQSQLGSSYLHDAWYETFGGITWNSDTVELNVGDKDFVQIEQRVYDIEPDTDYVFSFDLNYADGQHPDKQGFIFWEFKDRECKQTTSVYKDNWTNMAQLPNTPGRRDKKIVIHTQPDTHTIIFMVRSLKGAKLPFRLSKVKLEKGNKPTDWSPAPEDTANQLLNVGNTLKTYQTELNVLKDGMTLRTSEIAKVNDRIDGIGIQNLIYNSEFSNNAEGWTNIGNNPAGTILFANNEWDSWKGSPGLAFRNPNKDDYLVSESKRFRVNGKEKISASVQLHVTDTITKGNCRAGMEIKFYANETDPEISTSNQQTQFMYNIWDGQQKLLYCSNVSVPSGAKYVAMRLYTYGVGNIIFNQPMMTFSSSYLSYTRDNKSLGVLSEKYAALDVKVNGINSVVANKADVSYVDQRAGQWQAKLEGLQVGGTNLLYNTREYQGWDLYNCSVEDDNGAKTRIIHYWFGNGQQSAKDSLFRTKNSIYLVKGQQYTISCKAKYYSSNPTGREVGGQSLRMFSSYTDQHGGGGFLLTKTLRDQWQKYSCTFTSDQTGSFDGWRIINWINGSFEGGSIYVAEIKIEEGNRITDWSPAPEDNMAAITAVRNELNTAIDLRVQKGELLSQINMQAGRTLIQANKIYLDSESVVFSGKAFIPSAAIASLSADKINGGTINGRNINVINLNANNITSGSILGSNLNINLDSGYVSFQKGRIRSTTGTLDIDIDNGTLNIVDIWGNGVFARNGSIDFSKKSIWDKNKDPQYGRINRSSTILNEACDGMEIIGNEGIVMKSNNYNGWGYLLSDKINGAGVTLGKSGKMLLEASGPMTLMSGTLSDGIVRSRPQIKIGTNGWLDHGNLDSYGNNIYMIANGVCINANGETLIGTGGLTVKGRLGVEGSKNSIVDTSQGKTAINAYETAEYYFGDIAKANTGTSKCIKILIDPLFLETINTSIDYHVFVSSYGDGYAWISEMKEDYFVIESNVPNLTVSYEIKAKRKQYENVRLDKVDVNLKGENK